MSEKVVLVVGGDAGSFVSLLSFITVMVNFQGLFFLF